VTTVPRVFLALRCHLLGVDAVALLPCCVLQPAFPASSPYVTAVGGTQILRHVPESVDLEEVGTYINSTQTDGRAQLTMLSFCVGAVSNSVTGSIITGGGGFSNRFPAPSYVYCCCIAVRACVERERSLWC